MSVIIFIIILGLLIFVHELGHFLVAKKSGIRVDEFAVGFPPRIFSWFRNGTRYALNLIPFGGYVKIFGENPDEESMAKDADDSFVNKSKLTQAAVLIAGVLFNVVFAFILFTIAFWVGFDVPKDSLDFVDNSRSQVKVLEVEEGTPAFRAGIKEGIPLYAIEKDDERIWFNNSAENAVKIVQSTEPPFTILGGQGEKDLYFEIESKFERDGQNVVGFYMGDTVDTKSPFLVSVARGFLMTGYSLKEISIALKDLIFDAFKGDADLENVAGPVGIVGLVNDAAKSGIVSLILFTAFISINLAILNLLPFPALDGGRLLFILIEVITRKNINPKVANTLNFIGFAILIILMIVITISDIGKLI